MSTLVQLDSGTSATLSETFTYNGATKDLDAGVPTVTLTRPDGTAGPVSGTVVHEGVVDSGKYSFIVAAQANPIWFDITWVGTIGGQPQTLGSRVEWVGEPLFTLAALRAVKVGSSTPFSNTTTYPDQLLMDRRAEVTDDFQARTGWSFVPRFAREIHDGDGSGCLILNELRAHRLLSVTVNGIVQPVGNYSLRESGILEATSNYVYSGSFSSGRRNVTVEYVHGFERPPPAISTAALARCAMLLLPSTGSTTSSWTTPDGTTYSYDQAGQRFGSGGVRHYGVPGIDSVLNDPAYQVRGIAVA